MWLYKKIEFNTEREAVKQYRIFNVPVLEVYIRNLQSKKLHYSILPFFKKDRSYFENPVNKHNKATPKIFFINLSLIILPLYFQSVPPCKEYDVYPISSFLFR